MTTRRLFFACKLSEEARLGLSALIEPLRASSSARIRWLEPSGWHVTLKFLGEVEVHYIERLLGIADEANQGFPLSISFDRVEAFPSSARPLVLAATAETNVELSQAVTQIDSACSQLGFCAETRPFRCHVSLARVSGRRALSSPQLPTICKLPTVLAACVLMESVPAARGRRYVPVESR